MKWVPAVILAGLLLAGCGSSGGAAAGSEDYAPQQGQRPEATETSEPASEPMDASGPVVGDAYGLEDYEFRVLSVTEGSNFEYPVTELGFGADQQSYAGKFAVVFYSVRNTGPQPFELTPGAKLTTDTSETFQRADFGCDDLGTLQPRQLNLGCFVFDVPEDVTPESVWVNFNKGNLAPESFDLTSANLGEITPEETLALQYEYYNTDQLPLSYELFSEESQQQFTLAQYLAFNSPDYPRYAIDSYAFPSVEINGNSASVDRVLEYYDNKNYTTSQDRATQEFVREDGVWRVLPRPDQLEGFQAE